MFQLVLCGMSITGFILQTRKSKSPSLINYGRIYLPPLPYLSESSEASTLISGIKYEDRFKGQKLYLTLEAGIFSNCKYFNKYDIY